MRSHEVNKIFAQLEREARSNTEDRIERLAYQVGQLRGMVRDHLCESMPLERQAEKIRNRVKEGMAA